MSTLIWNVWKRTALYPCPFSMIQHLQYECDCNRPRCLLCSSSKEFSPVLGAFYVEEISKIKITSQYFMLDFFLTKFNHIWTLIIFTIEIIKSTAIPAQQTHFSRHFILCKHLLSLFLPFFLLQPFFGQRVTVIVSRQKAEITIFLWVKVETRQLWKCNRVKINHEQVLALLFRYIPDYLAKLICCFWTRVRDES